MSLGSQARTEMAALILMATDIPILEITVVEHGMLRMVLMPSWMIPHSGKIAMEMDMETTLNLVQTSQTIGLGILQQPMILMMMDSQITGLLNSLETILVAWLLMLVRKLGATLQKICLDAQIEMATEFQIWMTHSQRILLNGLIRMEMAGEIIQMEMTRMLVQPKRE